MYIQCVCYTHHVEHYAAKAWVQVPVKSKKHWVTLEAVLAEAS